MNQSIKQTKAVVLGFFYFIFKNIYISQNWILQPSNYKERDLYW